MPFLGSKTIRALYDVFEGGSPKAFRCMLSVNADVYVGPCNRVTGSLAGMIAHQRQVHNAKQQEEITFEEIKPTTE